MSYIFPDVSSNPRGIDGTIIYFGSIGSNRIFNFFRENANAIDPPKWNLYLINVFTLVRNAYQKGIDQKTLEQMVDVDSDTYMTYIGAYTSYRQPTQSAVLFYAPNYNAVPKDLMRVHMGNQEELDNMYQILCRKVPLTLMELTTVPETRKFLSQVGGSLFPHKDLVDKIRKICGNTSGGNIGTVMISHCPLDFHLYKTIPKLQLLESYTGAILSVPDFGQKLTKEAKIPFNTTTHRLFGDSLQLNPLLKGKDRKKLIEIANEFNWYMKTESEISNSALFKFPNLSHSDLTILKL